MRFTRKLISKRSTTNDHSNKSWRWFYVIGYIIYQAYTTYNNLYKHTTHKFRNAWLLHHQAYQTQFPPNVYFASHQIPGEWLHQIDTKFVAQIKLGWHQFTDSPPDRFDSNWLPTICSWHQSHLRTRDEKIYQNYVIKAKTNNGSIIFREQYKPFCKRSEFEGMLRIVWRTTRTCLWAGLGGWNGRRRRRGSVGCVWGGCGHRKRCIMSRRDIPYPWPLLFVQDVTAIYICDPQQTDQ